MVAPVRRPRREASVQRRNRFWAPRIAAAETPKDKAAVEWNFLRAEVHKMPDRASTDEAWQSIRHALKLALDEIRERQLAEADGNPYPSSRPAPLAVRAAGFIHDVLVGRR